MTSCFPTITTVLKHGPSEVANVLRRDGTSQKITFRKRLGFDLNLAAPKAMNESFAIAGTKERDRILTDFRNLVNEALVEIETVLGNPGLPVQLETHQEGRTGETFLHTHCSLKSVDVPNPQALYRWVGDQRRARKA